MDDSSCGPGTIPEQSHQKPSLRFLNRYVRGEVVLKWHDLGTELLDSEDVGKLDTIEADNPSDHDKCCVKMFKLWLKKQPTASWNQLIEALRQPDIELHTLATRIEQMLLQPKPKEQPVLHSVAEEPRLISITSLNADFTSLLLNVCHILSNCPNEQKNLEICKEYCALLKISDSSNERLLSAEKIGKVKECCNFKQLFEIVGLHMSWDEHSILIQIVDHCNSVEGQQEIERFEKKLALCEGLQIISNTSKPKLSIEFARFCVIINKPYKSVTIEEYKDVKEYIFGNLNTDTYVTVGFIRMLCHSLHIEWLVTIQAVRHMMRNAHQNKDIFIKDNFVFMQIGIETVIHNEGAMTQLLSRTQMLHFNELKLSKALKDRYTPPKATNRLSTSVNQQMRYFEPSIVADEFSCITKQVMKLFQSHDPKVLVEELEAIMASDKHNIKFLSDDQVEQLREHSNAQLLLQDINHLWSWSNHSMLRVLVGSCDEAIRLLDEFNCHLDPFEPIASYPVFEIMPTNPTIYTTLNVKAKKLSKITLQDVLGMCSEIVNKCGVTQHCLQLIATKNANDTVIIYWSIPKCVMNLIINKVLQHSDSFYDMGMVEVEIYPDIHIATVNVTNLYVCTQHGEMLDMYKKRLKDQSNLLDKLKEEYEEEYSKLEEHVEGKIKERITGLQNKCNKLSVEMNKTIKSLTTDVSEETSEMSDLAKQLQHVRGKCNAVLDDNRKLKDDQSVFLASLITREQRVKELEERVKELEEKNIKVQEHWEEESKEIIIIPQQSKCPETLEKAIQTLSIDETHKSSDSLLDQKVVEQNSKILMLEAKLQILKKQFEQLSGIHSKCRIQKEKVSVGIQTDDEKQQKMEVDELTLKLEWEVNNLRDERKMLLKKLNAIKEPLRELKHAEMVTEYGLLLGSGNYGKVYKYHYKGKSCARKVFFYHLLPGYPKIDFNKLVEQFMEKCSLVRGFHHPNVEQFIEINHIGIPVIITELLTESLTMYLSCTDGILHNDLQLSMCSDMAQGLEYLHSHQLMHGNLHGNNVLMTHNHHAKIADYLCPLLLTDVTTDNSLDYWAPETIYHKSITFQSNVFTLAVLFLEVFAKHPPQPSRDVTISELERRSSDLSRISENHLLLPLIQKCLSNYEAERPQIAGICKHLIQNKNPSTIQDDCLKGEEHVAVRTYTTIKQEERIIDTYGPTKKQFRWPNLLAKGPHGELIVGNNSEETKHVVIFDENLQYLRVIGNEKFQRICGMTVDKVGFLYVSDDALNCIQKFRLHDGKFICQVGTEGTQNGEFYQPAGLLYSKSNLLFVCDRLNHRIQVFQDDKFFYKFGKFGNRTNPGCFDQPVGLTLNSSEQQLFITDWLNDRIQVFTPSGIFIRQINNAPGAPFNLCTPNQIFFTQDGHLLVSSKFQILIFKEDGTFVSSIEGIANNSVIFEDSIGVIMMKNGKIVVADGLFGTNRLIVY